MMDFVEIREFFIIAFADAQPLGQQAAEKKEHFTLLGYIRESSTVAHRFTIAEHLDRIALKRLDLPGTKLKKLGRYMVTLLGDPTGDLVKFKDELYGALMEDGYICTRSRFYENNYEPHVTVGPAPLSGAKGPHPRKVKSFSFANLSVTESRFDLDYDFLGAEVLHTRTF